MRLFLIKLIIFIYLPDSFAAIEPASLILEAFSPLCPDVVTRNVQGTLYNIQALTGVVNEISSKEQCTGTGQVNTILTDYNRTIGGYENYQNSANDIYQFERNDALLTNYLNSYDWEGVELGYIQEQLITNHFKLVEAKTFHENINSNYSNYAYGAGALVGSVDHLFLSFGAGNSCFDKWPSLMASMVSRTMMATSMFASPGTALGLATGGMMIDSLNRFMQKFKYDKILGNFDSIRLPLAMRCVSSALTRQYCDASDTDKIIDTYFDDHYDDERQKLFGLEILSHHLRGLGEWLEEIYAGSPIASEGDLINRQKPILQAELLKKINRYVQTYGRERGEIFKTIRNPKTLSKSVAIAIDSLALIMNRPTLTPTKNNFGRGEDTIENPIFYSINKFFLPFKILEPNWDSAPLCSQEGEEIKFCANVLNYIRFNTKRNLTIKDWTDTIDNAMTLVQQNLNTINIKRAKKVSVDPFTVLVSASRDLSNETGPLLALQKIRRYATFVYSYLNELGKNKDLSSVSPSDNNALPFHYYYSQMLNIQKTIDLTDEIILLIKEGNILREIPKDILPVECELPGEASNLYFTDQEFSIVDLESKSFFISACITKILKLDERGNDIYFSKVRSIVQYEIEARLKNDDFGNEVDDILSSIQGDIIQTLMSTYNTNNAQIGLAEVSTGLETSMGMSELALDEFFNYMTKPFAELIDDEKVTNIGLADLCFRLLPYIYNYAEEDKKSGKKEKMFEKIYPLCKNKVLSFKHGEPLVWSEVFEEVSAIPNHKKSSEKANCVLHRYYKKLRMIEKRLLRR